MSTLRLAAVIACAMGAVLCVRASERSGPEPSELIHPRSSAAPAEPAGAPASTPPAVRLSIGATAGYVIALAVLIGGAWFLLKRGGLPRSLSRNAGRLQVLETRMLGNRQFLVVVEYDDARMLLGVCQGRIDYLTPLAGHPLAGAGLSEEHQVLEPAGGAHR